MGSATSGSSDLPKPIAFFSLSKTPGSSTVCAGGTVLFFSSSPPKKPAPPFCFIFAYCFVILEILDILLLNCILFYYNIAIL